MAYATELTRDDIAKMVVGLLGALPAGSAPSETAEDEIQVILNMAIKTFDSAGWCRQTVTTTTASVVADNWYKSLTTAAHSVIAAHFVYGADTNAHKIEIVSPQVCFSNGPIYARGIPTHACVLVPDVPGTAPVMYFNKRFDGAGSVRYVYKTHSQVLTTDSDKFLITGYGEEFLHAVVLMTALAMAPAFGKSLDEMQLLREQLKVQLNMIKTGQMLKHPGSLPILTLQTPPPPVTIGPYNM